MSQENTDRSKQEARNDDDSMERARRDLAEGNYVGKGMTSPDSTQVPLSADTGEPDERATRGDRSAQGDESRDRQAGSSGQGSEDRERNERS